MRGKKLLSVLAVLAAVSGAVIAVGKFLKKKGINIKEALDYKNNIFSEDDYSDEYDVAELQPLEDEADETADSSAEQAADSGEETEQSPQEIEEQPESDEDVDASQDD